MKNNYSYDQTIDFKSSISGIFSSCSELGRVTIRFHIMVCLSYNIDMPLVFETEVDISTIQAFLSTFWFLISLINGPFHLFVIPLLSIGSNRCMCNNKKKKKEKKIIHYIVI